MLALVPAGWMSPNKRVLRDGKELTLIKRRWFRYTATFALDGAHYEFRRTSWRTFVLKREGSVLAQARQPSLFRRTIEIDAGRERFELRATSLFRARFRLHRDSEVLGIVAAGAGRGTAELGDSVNLPVQLFTLFLVYGVYQASRD